jgi:hypothetical protein
MSIKSLVSAMALAWLSASAPAGAQSVAHQSQGSANISAASGVIAMGTASVVTGNAYLVVGSIQAAGESVTVVLRSASEAGTASLRLSRDVAAGASLAVGTVVQVTAESTGYVLSVAGRVIAFIPNEIGQSLLHQSRY